MTCIIFCIVIVGLLIYDLGFANKENKVLTFRQTIYFSLFYLIIACLFGIFIFFDMGGEKAREYYTCFFYRKSHVIGHAWASKNNRPTALAQIVREYVYAYSAVCPSTGEISSLILPYANSECMNIF